VAIRIPPFWSVHRKAPGLCSDKKYVGLAGQPEIPAAVRQTGRHTTVVVGAETFVNLPDMDTTWSAPPGNEDRLEGRDSATGERQWTATRVDLVFGSSSTRSRMFMQARTPMGGSYGILWGPGGR